MELVRSPDTKTMRLDFQSFNAISSSSSSSLIVTMPLTHPGLGKSFLVSSFLDLGGALISFWVFSFSDPSFLSVVFFVTFVGALLEFDVGLSSGLFDFEPPSAFSFPETMILSRIFSSSFACWIALVACFLFDGGDGESDIAGVVSSSVASSTAPLQCSLSDGGASEGDIDGVEWKACDCLEIKELSTTGR